MPQTRMPTIPPIRQPLWLADLLLRLFPVISPCSLTEKCAIL